MVKSGTAGLIPPIFYESSHVGKIEMRDHMTQKKSLKSPYGQIFKPPETIHDRTTAAAKQIIADEQQQQRDQVEKLKAARLRKEAEEASSSETDRKKPKKQKKR